MSTATVAALDRFQQQAVEAPIDQHVLITAPPGSGKTRVLTHRYLYLVQNAGIPAESIVAVTFTNKAANEMKQRISSALGLDDVSKLPIATFHSLAYRWLRRYHNVVDLPSTLTVFDESKTRKVIREIAQDTPYDTDILCAAISYLANQGMFPGYDTGFFDWSGFEERYRGIDKYQMLSIYREFFDRMLKLRALSFDMLILYAIRLFERKTSAEMHISHVLVDECQDINPAQYELLRQMAAGGALLYLTGDIDQSLYGFRGSRPELIEDFVQEFQPQQYRLVYNYRSGAEIVNVASDVIRVNYLGSNSKIQFKPIQPVKDGGLVRWFNIVCNGDQPISSAKLIADTLTLLVHSGGYKPGDIAVLSRASRPIISMLDEVMRELATYAAQSETDPIPVRLVLPRYPLDDAAKSFILFAANPHDVVSLRDLLERLKFIGEKTATRLANKYARSPVDSITDLPAVFRGDLVKGLSKRTRKVLDVLADAFDKIADTTKPLSERVYDSTLELLYILKDASEDDTSIALAIELAEQYNGSATDLLDLASMLNLVYSTYEDAKAGKTDSVVFSTIHSAKGLEYKVVVILEFPRSSFLLNSMDLTEERRVFYVAVTRAIERAYIISFYPKSFFLDDDFIITDVQHPNLVREFLMLTDVEPVHIESDFEFTIALSAEL